MESIRFCKISEIPKLQKFINDFWKEGHILSKNEELLKFQHLNPISNEINYVVAVNEENEFTAILGFIPNFQYDKALHPFYNHTIHEFTNAWTDIWLAIWMRSQKASKGMGMKLYEFLSKKFKLRSIAAIGINDKIKETYKSLGFTTGVLNHYYLLREDIKSDSHPSGESKPDISISEIDSFNKYVFENYNEPNHTPSKSVKYFKQRYKNHPSYKYKFYGIHNIRGLLLDVMVVRKNYYEDKSCLRIVDVYNNFFELKAPIEKQLQQILKRENSEYIDCLNYGLPPLEFTSLGFKKRMEDEIIIPNYFEPFENRNVNIECAYKFFNGQELDNYIIYKGDSDQDRPNI